MKQMTKEELIEYFIEQLGDNEILGQVMTIEQIREKLQTIIKEVTYSDEIGNFTAQWKIETDGRGIVNFDLRKILRQEEKEIVVHELLHALSTTTVTNPRTADIKEKCGIKYRKLYFEDGVYFNPIVTNMAINEGMTDFLAEQITGDKHNGYNTEKSIYKVLSIIIGQDTMMKKAFQEGVRKAEEPLDIFREELIAKYGEKLGIELNEEFKKVSTLSDQLLTLDRKDAIYGLNENGKAIQNKTRDEIGNILGNMIESIIDNEPDFTKKFALISKLQDISFFNFDSRRKISRKVESELINSKEFSYTQKVEMINTLRTQGVKFDLQTIEDMIFNLPEVQQFNSAEKLEYGMNLLNGYMLTKNSMSIFYRLYVECGKINDERFPKKEIIWRTLEISSFNTPQEIEKQLNEARYYELGEYYVLPRGEHPDNTVIFDEEGKLLKLWKIDIDPLEDDVELICDEMHSFPSINRFSEDKVKKISEQIKEKFEQFRISAKGDCEDRGIAIRGNILRLYYVDWEEKTESGQSFLDFYSIDEDGILQLIPKRH